MEKVERYRQILQHVLEDFANWLSGGPIKLLPICDVIHDEYLLVSLGKENNRREHSIVFHAQLRDGLICIEADWTEEGLSADLIAAGVDENDLRWSWVSHKQELPLVA
jgi:XisI protein